MLNKHWSLGFAGGALLGVALANSMGDWSISDDFSAILEGSNEGRRTGCCDRKVFNMTVSLAR